MFTGLLKNLKENRRTIVFTEGPDARIQEAAARLMKEDLMDVILVGNVDEVKAAAEKNGFDIAKAEIIDPANYAVWAGDILSDKTLADRLAATGPYPIVLANIVSDVIIPLSAFAGRFAAPGGKFLCSGIIDTRADEVEAALKKNGLKILERIERDGWCALCAEVAG